MSEQLRFRSDGDVKFSAHVAVDEPIKFGIIARNTYVFRCYDSLGNLKWTEEIHNLVVNEGLNDLLSKYFKGSAYTAAFYVGLVDNAAFTAFAAGDTAAQNGGTNGWTELVAYSQSTRPALTLGSVSGGSVDNSGSLAAYSINATKTIKGAFVVTNSTKAGTSGTIYGEGAFSSTRSLVSGDTLTVQATLTAATA